MPPDAGRVIWFIIGTVVILFAAYYVTYYIGMKASGRTRAGLRNRSIVVRDLYSISRDKSFCIVEIAGKVYIVGVAGASMTLLDTLDAEKFAEITENADNEAQMPWGNTPVGRYGNKLTQKVARYIASKFGKTPPDDDLGISEVNGTSGAEGKKTSFDESLQEAKKNAERNANKGASEEDD